ncbi:MAG TPA: S8 family serine peptidase [Ilumatobacteraceae bacterium]|nr:S8 family serine peptidase [Ilumatobacteraceae bacterium]
MAYSEASKVRPFPARRRRRGALLAVTAIAAAAVSLVSFVAGVSPAKAFVPPPNRQYPVNLPSTLAHPGSVIVAFKTPVAAAGDRVSGDGSGSAATTDLDAINATLAGLNATSVHHLFTNIPADKLAAARSTAEADTGAYVTDFTQVYEVSFAADVNPGEAANQLSQSALVSAAMPDWIFKVPSNDRATLSAVQVQQALAAVDAARNAPASNGTPNAASLPTNDAYRTDAQSYHDAASNNVTGAAAMIAKKFGQQPGQGEVVTNISLGTVDDTSTVLENGQRYIEQAGYPKIPVWLSSANCDADGSCNVLLDPTATNTGDGQGDFLEVNLDFSVMAPPPVGDPRVVNPAPAGTGQLLGEAYGASFRLINPLVNNTDNFVGAWLGGAFLQSPPPDVITASIGEGFGIGGFSDYFFEQEAIIHDAVSMVVGADIFVSISAGDGQTETSVAMNPNGLTGATNVTADPTQVTDIDDPRLWANPSYSYGLTVEPQVVIDSGANDAGANTLNDVFNNSPWNLLIPPSVSHDQHTIETRWTGQQNFHTGFGSRVNLSAPGDDVLILAQVEDANGVPVTPVASFPRLIGGSSASAPEIAGAAAVVRQAARLLHINLTARQVRDLLVATGRTNVTPAFDLDNANIGPALDLTAAVQALFDRAHANGAPSFARMTVAQRKTVLTYTDFRSSFWTDTPQDPVAGTATIDLSQGLVAPSGRVNETLGASGDNVNMPITFAVDSLFSPARQANYRWTLSLGRRSVDVPGFWADRNEPFVRLLPTEIFALLGQPVTSNADRVVTVTARNGSASISTAVTFKGQANGSYSHAVPPTFNTVFKAGQTVVIAYDIRGLRDGNGGQVDGGKLIVSDIDRTVPQAFPDHDVNVHGFTRNLHGTIGFITLSAADFPHGVGAYGIALRGTKHGVEVPDSTSLFLPLRFAPARYELPATPKIQAAASLLNGTAPLFYEAADIEPGGSTEFGVTYDVTGVRGATAAIIEFSAPTIDFASALFITGNFTPDNTFVNNFTNPNGDRLDSGNTLGQAGETTHVAVTGTTGTAVLDGSAIGLSIPDGHCDATYQVRVLATNAAGKIVGVAGNGSILSYGDFSRDACFPTP